MVYHLTGAFKKSLQVFFFFFASLSSVLPVPHGSTFRFFQPHFQTHQSQQMILPPAPEKKTEVGHHSSFWMSDSLPSSNLSVTSFCPSSGHSATGNVEGLRGEILCMIIFGSIHVAASGLEVLILSEVSQTEKHKYHMISLILDLKKWYTWTYLQIINRLTDTEKKLMVTKGIVGWGEINWEFGINIHTPLYVKQINNKDFLYSTRNYIQYLVITYNGK